MSRRWWLASGRKQKRVVRWLRSDAAIGALSWRHPPQSTPPSALQQALFSGRFGEHFADFVVSEVDAEGLCHAPSSSYVTPHACSEDDNQKAPLWCSFTLSKKRKSSYGSLQCLGAAGKKCIITGQKDTWAITSQRAFVPSSSVTELLEKFAEHRSTLVSGQHARIWVSDFKFCNRPAIPHIANRFCITLRSCHFKGVLSENVLHRCFAEGAINFYGIQRFGLGAHLSGRHLLRGEHTAALNVWLSALRNTSRYRDHVRALDLYLDGGDAASAAQALADRTSNAGTTSPEGELLAAIAAGQSPAHAVHNVSGGRWEAFCREAYWSWCWNVAASFRLQHYGTAVVPGDIVIDRGTLRYVDVGEEAHFGLNEIVLPRRSVGSSMDKEVFEYPEQESELHSQMHRYGMTVNLNDGAENLMPKLPRLARLINRLWNRGVVSDGEPCWVYRPLLMRPLFLHATVFPESSPYEIIDFERPSGILKRAEPLRSVLQSKPRVLLKDARPKPRFAKDHPWRGGANGDGVSTLENIVLRLEFALPRNCFATALLRELQGREMIC